MSGSQCIGCFYYGLVSDEPITNEFHCCFEPYYDYELDEYRDYPCLNLDECDDS